MSLKLNWKLKTTPHNPAMYHAGNNPSEEESVVSESNDEEENEPVENEENESTDEQEKQSPSMILE